MKKLALILLFLVILLNGCSNNLDNTTGNVIYNNPSPLDVNKIEIFHFHGTHQCYSCKTVGAYAEETVKTFFSEELDSEKIIFNHINGDIEENKDLVLKYDVIGSSLWLGVYDKEGNFYPEENSNVWYKIGNKLEYMNYLKGIIDKRLAGDLS